MPKYRVDFKMKCEGFIFIEADSPEEAREDAREDYENLWRECDVDQLDITEITEVVAKPEKGAASLHISLSDGKIEVSHGSDCTLLGSVIALDGDWDKLIRFLRIDLGLKWKED